MVQSYIQIHIIFIFIIVISVQIRVKKEEQFTESNILKLFLIDVISIQILPAIMEELYTSKILIL